jgi:hypothetical protein
MGREVLRDVFFCDGSLRDLYVKNVSFADWLTLLKVAKTYPVSIHPADLDLFGRPTEDSLFTDLTKLLAIDAGGVTICCHFFTPEEIELDIDPREVKGNEQVAAVFSFMHRLADALVKPVLLTPENAEDHPLLVVLPGSKDATYLLERSRGG